MVIIKGVTHSRADQEKKHLSMKNMKELLDVVHETVERWNAGRA